MLELQICTVTTACRLSLRLFTIKEGLNNAILA
jgi:hypothetical protein